MRDGSVVIKRDKNACKTILTGSSSEKYTAAAHLDRTLDELLSPANLTSITETIDKRIDSAPFGLL